MMQSQVRAGTVTAEEWLDQCEPGLKKTTLAMFRACKEIAYKIRTASCDKMACFNEFGDEQLAIDLLANTVIFENLKEAGSVATASSEETPTEDPIGGSGYSVAFDPLDGSSIIDTNFAVGTIWGVWPGSRLTGINGRDIASGGIAIYGPRTTITIALKGIEGAHEFLLIDDFSSRHGEWIKTNEFTTIGEGKLVAPGNLRATQDNEGYAALHEYWMKNMYQLRYTGGMVPDVNQLMIKGRVYLLTLTLKTPNPKFVFCMKRPQWDTLLRKVEGRHLKEKRVFWIFLLLIQNRPHSWRSDVPVKSSVLRQWWEESISKLKANASFFIFHRYIVV